jgi:hypothetical protein
MAYSVSFSEPLKIFKLNAPSAQAKGVFQLLPIFAHLSMSNLSKYLSAQHRNTKLVAKDHALR